MDMTDKIQAVRDAQAQVEQLIPAALATDAANNAMQDALREARRQLQAAQEALLAPEATEGTTPAPDGTTGQA
jgi:hypothetical protein